MTGIRLGQLVTSKTGRDAGRLYVVVGTDREGFVLVADGVRRPVKRPKRKNVRHLWFHGQVDERVALRLNANELPTNEEVRAALEAFERERQAAGQQLPAGAGEGAAGAPQTAGERPGLAQGLEGQPAAQGR